MKSIFVEKETIATHIVRGDIKTVNFFIYKRSTVGANSIKIIYFDSFDIQKRKCHP